MKVRVIYKPDKSVSIIYPAPKSKRPNETEKQWLKRVFTKSMQSNLQGLPYDDIDASELPQSREDRDAWKGTKETGIYIDDNLAHQLKEAKELEEKIGEKLREMAIKELEKEIK